MFSTYDAAAEVADTIQLNTLMKQTQLISSFRLTQPLTFEGLVHEGHFARAPPTLKLDTYEWINKVAASALGALRCRTHVRACEPEVDANVGDGRIYGP